MAHRFPYVPRATTRATEHREPETLSRDDASKIAGGDDFGSFDFGGFDFGSSPFGGSDPFGGDPFGTSDPFGGGGSFGTGSDPFGTGGSFGTGSDPFGTGDPFHTSDPFNTGSTGSDPFGTSTGSTPTFTYDPNQFVGPIPPDDHATTTPFSLDTNGNAGATEPTPDFTHDPDPFVGPLPPDGHAGDDHLPAEAHLDTADNHLDTSADHHDPGPTDDLHRADPSTDTTHADDQTPHTFDTDPDHHAGVSDVTTNESGNLVTHFADGSSLTTDNDGNVLSFTEPPHDAATTGTHDTNATGAHDGEATHANVTGTEDTHAADPTHTTDATSANDTVHGRDDSHATDTVHADAYGPDFVGPIPSEADGHHDDVPVVPALDVAHGDDHVDTDPHHTSDAGAHPSDDVAHDTGAAHDGISTELDHASASGVLSVELDQDGHTVTHFADGSSATLGEHGEVIAFTEPHPTTDGSDPAHPSADPHAQDGTHHSDGDTSHPDASSATSPAASLIQSPNVGDCFVVSSLNEIASRPGGMEYLRSLVTDRGDGLYEVTLQGPNGPETVLVQANGQGASASGPNQADGLVLQVIEQGIGAARSEGYGGNRPDDGLQSITLGGTADSVFTQLGLTDVQSNGTLADILKDQDRVPVDVNTVLEHIQAGDPVTLGTFSDGWRLFDLTPNHEYSVGAVITDENGIPAIVFNNPDGTHSKPVPITALNDAGTLTWGTIPGGNTSSTSPSDGGQSATGTPSLTATGYNGPSGAETADSADSHGTDTTDTYTYGNGDDYGGYEPPDGSGGYF